MSDNKSNESRSLTSVQQAELEDLVDATSLSAVLAALEDICRDKAEHIIHSWQDINLAKEWSIGAGRIGRANDEVKLLRLG